MGHGDLSHCKMKCGIKSDTTSSPNIKYGIDSIGVDREVVIYSMWCTTRLKANGRQGSGEPVRMPRSAALSNWLPKRQIFCHLMLFHGCSR
jgi:hypothetical protein